IVWTGEVDDVRRVLAACDAVAVPSTGEAFSMVAVEAMAARRPVVASRAGGVLEVVVDGETGALVEPRSPRQLAAAVVHLARNPRRRLEFGRAGLARARRLFSAATQVPRIEDVLARAAAATAARRPAAPRTREFDPTLAEFRTIELPCAVVVDLLPLTHAPDRVARYREQMEAGDRFPPISVIRLAGRYVIADGHKPFSAYRALGADRILVEVWPARRGLRDQWDQVVDNARKNGRILRLSVTDPPAAWRLLCSTLLHWQRVAASLAWRAT